MTWSRSPPASFNWHPLTVRHLSSVPSWIRVSYCQATVSSRQARSDFHRELEQVLWAATGVGGRCGMAVFCS